MYTNTPHARTAGVSTFVKEFIQRKSAEQNRKAGGKKKKKAGAAAAPSSDAGAAAPVYATPAGVSAAGLGLVNAASGDSEWARIPKKAGAKKKKAPGSGGGSGAGGSKFVGMDALLDADD